MTDPLFEGFLYWQIIIKKDYVMHTLTGGEDTGCPQRRSSKVLFNVRIEIIEKFRSTVGQCAFPRVAMWVWKLKVIERGSRKTAQRST